jgi:glutamine synthetase
VPPDPHAGGFVDRHGLGEPDRTEAAASVLAAIQSQRVEVIRLSFVDQHGVLRGKTMVAAEAARLMRDGCGAPSSLLLKDIANRTVFAAYSQGGGVGISEMQGAGDILMIPDPSTFKVLPWAPHTGWLLCDLRFTNGADVPFSTRDLFRRKIGQLSQRGYGFVAGAELEFHLFRLKDPRLQPEDAGQPGAPPEVELVNQGYQYLSELRYDELDQALEPIRYALEGLGLPLVSLEIEYGPSQCEITFQPLEGVAAADLVILARSAVKQAAARNGYHATFMCRPRIPNVVSSGWHLHQSLRHLATGVNAFAGEAPDDVLSGFGRAYLAGLLAHAPASTPFSTPTINGYKRYRPYSNAPDRAIWGQDNRGAMVRVIGGGCSSATRLENRIGEPAANPYLYMATQIISGLDGVDRSLDPGPSADTPYETTATLLPRSLEEALMALDASACLRQGFSDDFVDYWLRLKRAELDRFNAEVSDWEQREYFSLF